MGRVRSVRRGVLGAAFAFVEQAVGGVGEAGVEGESVREGSNEVPVDGTSGELAGAILLAGPVALAFAPEMGGVKSSGGGRAAGARAAAGSLLDALSGVAGGLRRRISPRALRRGSDMSRSAMVRARSCAF